MSIYSFVEIESRGHRFDQLPKQIASCFSDQERDVYNRGSIAIRTMLEALGESKIINACSVFRDNYPFRVYIEDFLDVPKVWFALSNFQLVNEIRVMVPTKVVDSIALPERIKKFYLSVGGLTSGTDFYPRFSMPKRLVANELKSELWSIISYGNGDHLVTSGRGEILLFDHTTNEAHETSLDKALDLFVADLFKLEEFP